MRELALVGFIALLSGLVSYYAIGELGTFSSVNLGLGALALAIAAALGLHRLRFTGGPLARRVIGRGLLGIALALAIAVGLERWAAWQGLTFDWTFEQRYDLSEAVQRKLAEICSGDEPLVALFYFDPEDPRKRATGLLLETLQRAGPCLEVRERRIEENLAEVDRYAVGSSNTVVFQLGDAFETVPRPMEGTIYEALYRLTSRGVATLAFLRGEGEGDPERTDGLGYSGLAAALTTEGYQERILVSASLSEVPEDVDALIVIAPERPLLPQTLDALQRYLESGGSLVALLEPGRESGIEGLLAGFGIEALDGLVVDPASAPVDEGVRGVNVLAFNYAAHPVTAGLNRSRMTYFPGVRPLHLRKPRVEDDVQRVVLSSHRGWVSEDLSWLARSTGLPASDGAQSDYQTLAAVGRYPRDGKETRLVVFGDADFASNRYLRALYDLDLVLNAVHWATQRESAITLRPKALRTSVQFPVPLTSSVQALYGVGLLLPELLLIAGGLVWLRRRRS